jgi:chromosome segregation ATPase
MNLTPPLPPATLTDDAMKLAASLLQICADPLAAKSRLDELSEATVALRSAIDEHAAAKTQAETATAALADVERRARDVAAQADALASERTRLDVASSANAARAQSLDDREAELNKREQEHQARVKANEDRIASVRASLA